MDRDTLLLIDDDALTHEWVRFHLRNHPIDVLGAEDPESGLAMAFERRPHLILLDVNMPGLDGFDLCRQLRADERTCDIPCFFLSADDDPYDVARGLGLGAIDYLRKPVDGAELRSRIDGVLHPKSPMLPHLGTRKVLVIDDDPMVHNLLDLHRPGRHVGKRLNRTLGTGDGRR